MEFIEIGRITSTHGIHGEVRIEPWCDSSDVFCAFDKVYIDGNPFEISARPHKSIVIAAISGVDSVGAAATLRNKIVSADKNDFDLPEGRYFITDLIGLSVVDADTGLSIGTLSDVLTLPANDVYVVTGEKRYMIPAVSEFVLSTDIASNTIKIRLIEGMAVDEN